MSARAPNVLLVVLDSLKAKNVGLYGYERETTPFLESFAASDATTVYTQARAPGMTSYPSHTSIFTGLEVAEHGAHDLLTHQLDPSRTIWHTLSTEFGYETGVFSDNVNLTGEKSLASAFDHVVGRRGRLVPDAPDPDKFFNSPEYLDGETNGSKHLEYLKHCLRSERTIGGIANGAAKQFSQTFSSAALERRLDHSADRFLDPFYTWIDSVDGPWAACLNLMDTHLPFCPAKEHDLWGGSRLQRTQAALDPTSWNVYGGDVSWDAWNSLENIYDGTIRQVDHYLADLVDQLKGRGCFDDTLLVITSDHGEGFGEYSRVKPDFRIAGHIVGLHESLLHVPLIVSAPEQSNGETVTDLATLRRFPDAVTEAVDGEIEPDAFVPNSPVVASASTIDVKRKNRQRARKYCGDLAPYEGPIRAVYRSENGTIRKYLTWGDRGATVEIEDAQRASVVDGGDPHEEVASAFERFDEADVVLEQGEIGDETKTHLQSLGYL
ncbi:sulfatase-like hydrolase/transferase [Salinilacihabitans rarus]|uniref:sulfatase-like hydrolase/transferase n=1 Tax=Salinilacihabitans rarus TaxID=2961596 RepID=UPI0020C8F0FE|nr:sulfatase-like hydrolase/transferase [Salinilacihabitans rarus]